MYFLCHLVIVGAVAILMGGGQPDPQIRKARIPNTDWGDCNFKSVDVQSLIKNIQVGHIPRDEWQRPSYTQCI